MSAVAGVKKVKKVTKTTSKKVRQTHSNLLMIAFVSKVDGGGETLTETTTTMSRETSGTLGTKETSGSLGREENGQPLALRSKVYS